MSTSVSSEKVKLTTKRDIGGIVCAALFILIGAACFYETTQMTDPDSYVFPRMVISGLMILSFILIVTSLSKPGTAETEEIPGKNRPSTPRRVLLVATLLGVTLLMPIIGFVLSGLGAFIALMLLAQYEPWNKTKMALYIIVSVAIVGGFYGAFSYLLHVPLPEGVLFQSL
ncbi:MAG: tripartite tricarboxylate transporter TctB family protein [Amphritea sp.]